MKTLLLVLLPYFCKSFSYKDSCSSIDTNTDPSIATFSYEYIKQLRNKDAMRLWAEGTQTFQEYQFENYIWILVFLILFGFALILFLMSIFYINCNKCCGVCKKNLKRTDYQKCEKVAPFVFFFLFSIISMGIASYNVYLLTKIEVSYSHMKCQTIKFSSEIDKGSGISNWKGFSSLEFNMKQLDEFISDQQSKFSQIFDKEDPQWIYDSNSKLDIRLNQLWDKYKYQTVNDFQNNQSQLTIFSDGIYGPIEKQNTTINQLSLDKNLSAGQKVYELQDVIASHKEFTNPNFSSNIQKAKDSIIKPIQDASLNQFQKMNALIETIDPYKEKFMYPLYSVFGFILFSLFISTLIMGIFLITKSASIKCLNNYSWIGSCLSLICLFGGCLILVFNGQNFLDFCNLMDDQYDQKKVDQIPNFVETNLSYSLQQCMFSSDKSLIFTFGINDQLDFLRTINQNLEEYVKAPMKGGVKEVNNVMLAMMTFQKFPSTLEFVQDSDVEKVQPKGQLDLLNQMTNLDYPNNSYPLCDDARDLYVESKCPDDQDYEIVKRNDPFDVKKGFSCCLIIDNFSQEFINRRYSNSEFCLRAKTRFAQYKSFQTAISDPQNGLLFNFMVDLNSYSIIQTQVINRLRSIDPRINILQSNFNQTFNDLLNEKTGLEPQLDCSILLNSYKEFRKPICEGLAPGLVEIVVLSMIIGLFLFINIFLGLCFSMRNRINVPQQQVRDTKKYEEKYQFDVNTLLQSFGTSRILLNEKSILASIQQEDIYEDENILDSSFESQYSNSRRL